MSRSGLVVVRPGVQSSLQDLGRFGCAQQGLSQGGAMDLHAHCWANKLLGNAVSCPTLEIVIGMAGFRAECDLWLAIAGADMQPSIDGQAVANWSSFLIKQGQTLDLKPARDGMRSYLATAGGGFQVPIIHGSVSTVVRNGMGGLADSNGALLKEGDFLPADRYVVGAPRRVPSRYLPTYGESIELRVIESYQVNQFEVDQKEKFYRSEYKLTADCDRMGARLEGESITGPQGDLISEGITLGSIQIPEDGQPIILLNDRQTLGGYPKLGCVARVDLHQLAQARPGTRIRFVPIEFDKARSVWQEFCRFFGRV